MEIKIKDVVARQLLRSMFVEHPNVSQAVDMLFSTCNDNTIANLLEILMSDESYVPYKIGTWVLVSLDGYQVREMGDQCVLQDMNLMEGDKFIGYIKSSGNYGEDFEPYHDKMEVNSFICNSEGKVEQKVMSIYASQLSLIHDEGSIKVLNNIKNNLV